MWLNRLEYTPEQERQLRITNIQAILENNLYPDENEKNRLMEELKELEALTE